MHRIDNLHIPAAGQTRQTPANLFKPLAKTLAPVRRHNNQLLRRIDPIPVTALNSPDASRSRTYKTASIPVLPVTLIDSFGTDSRRRLSAAHSVAAKCKARQPRGQQPIRFLGERLGQVASPKSRLHMAHRNTAVERG